MKAFVVFGSQSDSAVFDPFVDGLRARDIETDFEVISAHRNLEKLQDTMKQDKWDVIVAGAGLAAALPGVAAAMTDKPVFGIPVKAHFGGLDALASIAQMPYGVPVLSCGAGREDEITAFLDVLKYKDAVLGKVNIIIDSAIVNTEYAQKEMTRFKELAIEKGVAVTLNDDGGEAFDIVLVSKEDQIRAGGFCIHVPLLDAEKLKDQCSYLMIYDWMDKGGIWVCVNNARNALLATLKLFHK